MRRISLLIIPLFIIISNSKVHASTELKIPLEEDTYVEENYPDIAPWNNRNLYLGNDSWYGKGQTRLFFRIPYSKIKQNDILPNEILSIKLNLVSYSIEGSPSDRVVEVAIPTENWNSTKVTWNNQPSITNSETVTIPYDVRAFSIDLSTKLKTQYAEYLTNNSNNGIAIRTQNANSPAMILWSLECASPSSPPICNNEEPTISVVYTKSESPPVCSFKAPGPNHVTSNTNVNYELQPTPSVGISYEVEDCNNTECSTIISTSTPDTATKGVIFLPEGQSFIRCVSINSLGRKSYSVPQKITVDTIKPDSPQILDEPEYTAGSENIIYWLPPQGDLLYQLQYSEREDFSRYNTTTGWMPETSYVATALKEKKYYYRVHSKDVAGNISNWSRVATSTQDYLFPTVSYFKSSKTIISPKLDSGNEISGDAYIQGSADDVNLQEVGIKIFTSKKKEIFSVREFVKSYLWIHWPDKLTYPDDQYILYFYGIDGLGRTITSNPLFLTIDRTPPSNPSISGIKNGAVTNKLTNTIKASCESGASTKLYIGGKLMDSGITSSKTVTLKEGSHTVKAVCTDKAENASEKSIKFSIDTSPPKQPAISFKYKTRLEMYFTCSEKGSYYVLTDENTLSGKCNKSEKVTLIVASKPISGQAYAVLLKTSDSIGNWNDYKSALYSIPEIKKQLPKGKITCSAEIFNGKTSVNCDWNNFKSELELSDKSNSKDIILEFPRYSAQIKVQEFSCKQKSFWDMFTWFSCVKNLISEKTINTYVFPVINSSDIKKNGLVLKSDRFIISGTKTNQNAELSGDLQGTVSVSYKTINQTTQIRAESNNFPFSIPIPNIEIKKNKPLGWVFSRTNIEVSQWYGFTKFQSPHAGIDFSIASEKIYAPADGTIVSVAHHNKGACYSGGKYVGIKHKNGLYTYYFHLSSVANNKIFKGAKVKKGDYIAISGKTGSYNCSPLAYHLHYEVRTSQLPKDHLDPVPKTDVDWSDIKTAKAKIYPGRLSGNNPHSKY